MHTNAGRAVEDATVSYVLDCINMKQRSLLFSAVHAFKKSKTAELICKCCCPCRELLIFVVVLLCCSQHRLSEAGRD